MAKIDITVGQSFPSLDGLLQFEAIFELVL